MKYNSMKKAGIRPQLTDEYLLRSISRNPKEVNHWQVIKDYQNGASLAVVARKHSISKRGVRRRLVAEGIPIREQSDELQKKRDTEKIDSTEAAATILKYMEKHRSRTSSLNQGKYVSRRWGG